MGEKDLEEGMHNSILSEIPSSQQTLGISASKAVPFPKKVNKEALQGRPLNSLKVSKLVFQGGFMGRPQLEKTEIRQCYINLVRKKQEMYTSVRGRLLLVFMYMEIKGKKMKVYSFSE